MGCCTKHLYDILAQNLHFLPRLLVKTTHVHPILPVLHGDLHLPWAGTSLDVNKPLLALVDVCRRLSIAANTVEHPSTIFNYIFCMKRSEYTWRQGLYTVMRGKK